MSNEENRYINTDIYNIADITEKVKSNFIDEEEETLAASTLGFMSSIAADSMREAIRVTAKMANETIYSKATLQSSIITHAMVLGIKGIYATPAKMQVRLVLNEEDINKMMGTSNKLVIDRTWKIMIDDFEYHLDYDIIMTKTTISGNKNVYSARYDMSVLNKLSDITNPYIDPPNTIIMDNGVTAIVFNVIIRQIYHTVFYNKFITNNIIDNKTFMFTYDNQICNFTIKIKNGNNVVNLEPVYEGTVPKTNMYCYYSFITTNKIRIKFDRTVFIPELSSEAYIDIYTSSGTDGNFSYNANFESIMKSDNYDYKNSVALFIPITDSVDGVNQKSSEELRSLLPIEATSRGSIGNADDLTSHFNLENNSYSRIIFKNKAVNQFENSYYTYLALKDNKDNMIPTNTIDMVVPFEEFNTINRSVGYRRYVLKHGCYILSDGIKSIVKMNPTYKELKDAKFVYTTPFMCAITDSQLQTSYYMSMVNDSYELTYDYINLESNLQFVTTNINFNRKYIQDKDKYFLTFQLTQNITSDMGVVIEKPILDEEGNPTGEIEVINNLKVLVILYKNGAAYRYKVANLKVYDLENFVFGFQVDFDSADLINEDNDIRINNVNIIGQDEETFDYAYFNANTEVKIYVLYKGDAEYGRYNIDDYVPGLFGYTLSNVYSINGGINFFKNYTNTISSIVDYTKYNKTVELDMDWDIKVDNDNVLSISNGKLNIPYLLFKDTDIKLTVEDNKTGHLYFIGEYNNISKSTSDEFEYANIEWSLRDFSTLKGTYYEGLSYDEDGNYIFHEKDLENEIINNINNSYIRIINESTDIKITLTSNTNFFSLDHIVSKKDINAILNNEEIKLDYNISDYTQPDTKVEVVDAFKLSSVPVIRRSYLDSEDKVRYIINELNKKKDFIETSDAILESPFTIDIKLVNTYGRSKLYTLKDNSPLDRVNLSLKFDLKLKTNADSNVVTYIIDDIKSIIESINKDLEDIHIKVLEDTIMKKYENAIVYIECTGINDYNETVKHLYLTNVDTKDIPEFICINSLDNDETEPDISITLV